MNRFWAWWVRIRLWIFLAAVLSTSALLASSSAIWPALKNTFVLPICITKRYMIFAFGLIKTLQPLNHISHCSTNTIKLVSWHSRNRYLVSFESHVVQDLFRCDFLIVAVQRKVRICKYWFWLSQTSAKIWSARRIFFLLRTSLLKPRDIEVQNGLWTQRKVYELDTLRN